MSYKRMDQSCLNYLMVQRKDFLGQLIFPLDRRACTAIGCYVKAVSSVHRAAVNADWRPGTRASRGRAVTKSGEGTY